MLPIEYEEENFVDALDKRLQDYQETLKKYFGEKDTLIEHIIIFRKNLKSMFAEYYLGHHGNAYVNFKSALSSLIDSGHIVYSVLPKESLYRARINRENKDFKNSEMFHIKFELRGKVQTQRFSFPGLPCLYLGGSSYVCWLELNRPQFDQFQVASIRQTDLKTDFKMIDLCIHPNTFLKEFENSANEKNGGYNLLGLKEYLQWWPVMAACSVAVKNESDSFKPEYVFPQFMLQYLLEELPDEYVGIKYMSIKAGKISKKQYESDHRTYTNYVIPIRTSGENSKGFCSFLNQNFSIKNNFSGKELQVLTDSIRVSGIQWGSIDGKDDSQEQMLKFLDKGYLYGTNDVAYQYSKSIFFRIETILENEDLHIYDDDGNLIIMPIPESEIDALF